MIVDEGKLAIPNKHLTRIREELYRALNNNVSKKKITKQQWWNEIASSICENQKTYKKRLAPHGSPSHK